MCNCGKKKKQGTKNVYFISHSSSGNWLTDAGTWTTDPLKALPFDEAIAATKYAIEKKIKGWKLKEYRL